ncbi:MAG: hypothetical protein JXR37_07900 [Kiritimatiellae bacterium]|nr:hypothetical protein [Kiritimatiellia bacterium]
MCIYYHKKFCELEPIGPMEKLQPGEAASFTEDWWLLPYPFPEDGEEVNPDKLTGTVEKGAR